MASANQTASMLDDFVERAKGDFARLLPYWREIERWIKQAEQVNNKAVIPAINELRYASRQLFNAQVLFSKNGLSEGEKSSISKRIIIAEQYLLNADHDIVDSIVAFYKQVVEKLDDELGRTAITDHFPRYPLVRDLLKTCDGLIADARHDYSIRRQNYTILRNQHFPSLLSDYDALLSAEIGAKESKARLNHQLALAKGKADLNWWVGIGGFVFGLIALIFAYFTWTTPYEDFCKSGNKAARLICRSTLLPKATITQPTPPVPTSPPPAPPP